MKFIDWLKSLCNLRSQRQIYQRAKRGRSSAWKQPLGVVPNELSVSLRLEILEDRTLPSANDPVQMLFPVLDHERDEAGHDAGVSPQHTSLYGLPSLPGLMLVDPNNDARGQIIFLVFDGAEDVIYNGPITVGPFDVPAFEAPGELTGQKDAIIVSVVEQLGQTFAGSGVIFTTEQPADGVEYSTIYVGGDDLLFSQYGSFTGLAENVDVGNQDLKDNAFVFTELLLANQSADMLTTTIEHEVAHLLG